MFIPQTTTNVDRIRQRKTSPTIVGKCCLDHSIVSVHERELVVTQSRTLKSHSRNAGSDPEAFRLRPACCRKRPGSYMPDRTSRIRFSSVFPKKARMRLCKTDPDPIWMAWSGFGQTHLVWKQAGVQESLGHGLWQDVTGPLPVSQFQNRLRSSTDVPDNTVQNQPESDLVLPDCVRFGPNASGPEASQCARIIRPASGQCFPADPDRMRIVSGMFTRLQGLCFRLG